MQAAASLQTLNEYAPPAAGVTRSQSVSGLLAAHDEKIATDKPCNLVALSQDLTSAIQAGDEQQAQVLSRQLAQVAANLEITPLEQLPPASINVKVNFEDLEGSHGFVILDLRPNLTIDQLKWKMLLEHGLPPEVQVWIIRKRIPRSTDTLEQCGLVPGEQSSIYLYLASRQAAGLTDETYQRKYGVLFGDDPNADLAARLEDVQLDTSAVGTPPAPAQAPSPAGSETTVTQESEAGNQGNPLAEVLQGSAGRATPNLPAPPPEPEPQPQGWSCTQCTYFNIPTRPGCEVCAAKRPDNYVVPANFELPEAERLRLEQERLFEEQLHEGPPGGLTEQQRLAALIALNDQYNQMQLAGIEDFHFDSPWLNADEPDVASLLPDIVGEAPQNSVEEDSGGGSDKSVEAADPTNQD